MEFLGFGIFILRDAAIFFVQKALAILLVIMGFHILIRISDRLLGRLFRFTLFDPTLESFAHKTIITALWLIAFGISLIVLGVDISAVITSFGIGSFIVGFALKDTLNNFAAGVMVLVNSPFKVGDEIEVRDIKGRVKSISMSYTLVEDENSVYVTIPNSIVWSNPIKNHSTASD